MANCQKTSYRGVHTHFTPPLWFCYHDSGLWVVVAVIWSAIWWHLWAVMPLPLPNIHNPADIAHPLHITLSLHLSSVDAPADVHGRSHSFPLIHPRVVCLVWCWVIARPLLSCDIYFLSLPLGVGLTGVGLVHLSHVWWTPTHKGMPALTWWGGVYCGWRFMTVHIGLSLCRRGCLSWSDVPPNIAHLPPCLLSSSFP